MRKRIVLLCVWCTVALGTAHARDLFVGTGEEDYTTIQAAMDAAESGDRVVVRRDAERTYAENFTLAEDVVLEGEETAATILSGSVTFAEGATLRRLTLKGTVTLTGIARGTIENNILQTAGKAIQLDPAGTGDAAVAIAHNTFLGSASGTGAGTGVELLSASSASIERNLFAGLQTAILSRTDASLIVENNRFHGCTAKLTNGVLSATNTEVDPEFLDETASPPDLHLRSGSAACGADVGAYSGENADPTPSPVTGVTATEADGSVDLAWDQDRACGVTVAEYWIRFAPQDSAEDLSAEPVQTVAPQDEDRQTATVPTASLPAEPPSTPAPPTGLTVSPLDGGLRLSWTPVDAADGYLVSWGKSAASLSTPKDVGDVTEYDIGGLENGVAYSVSVSSYADELGYFSVSSVATEGDAMWESRPSALAEAVIAQAPSAAAATGTGTPEQIAGWPALEDKSGCFITGLGLASGTEATAGAAGLVALASLWVAAIAWGRRRRTRARALLPLAAGALLLWAQPSSAWHPAWTFSLGGGAFFPRQDGWTDHYDHRAVPEGKLGLGLRLLPQLEIGVDGGVRWAEGKVKSTNEGTPIDPPLKQTLWVFPLQAYALVQLRVVENQWVIPYVAGGYSRYYYRHEVEDGDKVDGHMEGYHGRGGLKILANRLDPWTARTSRETWGLHNTYVVLEAQYAKVDDPGASDIDLGGMSYLGGIVFEF